MSGGTIASGQLTFEGNLSWSNSATINTAGTFGGNGYLTVTQPSQLQRDSLYTVAVTNSSADSDLTVVLKNAETYTGLGAKFPELLRFSVPKSNPDGKIALVQGFLCSASGGQIVITNDTALSGSGAFTAYVLIRKV